ncbi:hypothetical protein MTR67_048341 [Solanum verrucosum]|uniref:Uncharacterized protein n=1 Tax=Solanum verrucosum TaxID=315347 RepID=A0AAF0V1F3_SOLVR|nr:hypothetical protein MTR67_048341 [Solanum verrucosum]
MPRVTSDHCPIILQCGDWDQRKSYFKFENWWLNVDGFEGLVHSWWNEFEVEGCPDYNLSVKLKMLNKNSKIGANQCWGVMQLERQSSQ